MTGPGFRSRQPGTAVYTIFTIVRALIKLPLLSLLYLVPGFRPIRQWTYGQALGCALLRVWFKYASAVRFQMPFSLDPGAEKERFQTISPWSHPERIEPDGVESSSPYRGILLLNPAVKPTTIGSTWFPAPYSGPHQPGRRVILHFHGGAYVMSGCRDSDMGFGASLILHAFPGSSVFCPQYRLASYPNCEFPAALQDAVTAYKHLFSTLEIPPTDIILSGDSAGAHLVLSLLRYIHTEGQGTGLLPAPCAALLWSPWVDLSISPQELDNRASMGTDFVPAALAAWANAVYVPPKLPGFQIPQESPYISPTKEAIATTVPIWVTWGGAEVLKKDTLGFVDKQKRASEAAGGRLGTWETPFAPHDIFLGGHILAFKDEAKRAAEEAAKFVDRK